MHYCFRGELTEHCAQSFEGLDADAQVLRTNSIASHTSGSQIS